MVSNASDDLPLPLRPVMTTSLSRGMFSVRFFRLCSRAPPMRMNSLLMAANFQFKPNGKDMPDCGESKGGCCAGRYFAGDDNFMHRTIPLRIISPRPFQDGCGSRRNEIGKAH